MPTINLENKRATIQKAVTLGVGLLICGTVGVYAYQILEGLMAIAAVGSALVVSWLVGPALGTWVANNRIALLKAAIEANPIETMQNIAAEKLLELDAQSKAITAVSTQYLNVRSLIDNLPPKLKMKAANYEAIADKLKAGLDQMKKSYDFASRLLADYNSQIEEAQSLWEVACAVNTAIKVSEKAKMDTFRDIKNKVAFDTVTTSLNHAFASLDEAVRVNQTITDLGTPPEEEAPKALAPAEVGATVIDLGTVRAGQRVSIKS